MSLDPVKPRKPESDFGNTGVRSRFRGPYAGGPRARDLEVDKPPIDAFVDGLVSLGPTYVKLGQIIASSPGLFPRTSGGRGPGLPGPNHHLSG